MPYMAQLSLPAPFFLGSSPHYLLQKNVKPPCAQKEYNTPFPPFGPVKFRGRVPLKQVGCARFCAINYCMAYMTLLGSDFEGKAKSTHSKAANTADTVGTAPQSHSVGMGPAICFDAGACEFGVRVGGMQRAGKSAVLAVSR